ncbi:MAG: hypothetical protein PHX78_07530 [bacterium]|nr:hypothetical protein [bacterium]
MKNKINILILLLIFSLVTGDNTITAAANFFEGIAASGSASLEFLSDPRLIPDTIFINEETKVVVSIAIENNKKLDISSIKLLELDSSNNIIETTIALRDNGDAAIGDDKASDDVFSGKIIINRNTKGKIKFRVSADTIDSTGTMTNYSVISSLSVITHLTDEEISISLDMPENIQRKYDEFKKVHGEEKARTKTVEWLKTLQSITQAGESEGNIWYVLKSGINGVISLDTN